MLSSSSWACRVKLSIISSNISPCINSSSLWKVRLILWSVTLPCGKLYVLILSDLSPVPILLLLSLDLASSIFCLSHSYILDLRIFNPFSLFLICDFSSCWLTTIPVGMGVILTAESVVFTLCPPGPLLLKTSILKSFS